MLQFLKVYATISSTRIWVRYWRCPLHFWYLALYCGAFYNRCTDFDLTVVVCEQDFVETYGRIFFALETVNIKFPTFFSLELLTCNLYDYVHSTCN